MKICLYASCFFPLCSLFDWILLNVSYSPYPRSLINILLYYLSLDFYILALPHMKFILVCDQVSIILYFPITPISNTFHIFTRLFFFCFFFCSFILLVVHDLSYSSITFFHFHFSIIRTWPSSSIFSSFLISWPMFT